MNDKIFIFLSRPNPFLKEHEIFLDKLKEYIKKYDMETITLQAANYDLTDSLRYLKGMIKQCYGMIIVGFNQYYFEKGYKKRGGKKCEKYFCPEEKDVSKMSLSSPFCQIEGTIGITNDLPILILNQENVIEEGILMGGRYSVKTKQFSLDKIDDFFSDPIVSKQISVWVGKVIDYHLFLTQKRY